MNKSILLSLGLTLIVVYVPFLNPIFDTIPLGGKDWLVVGGFSLLPFVVGELFKYIYHSKIMKRHNGKQKVTG